MDRQSTTSRGDSEWEGPNDLADRALQRAEDVGKGLGISQNAARQASRAVYIAGQQTEEGRSLRFQLCLLQEDNLPTHVRLQFESYESLSPSRLRRLAPAVPPSPFAFAAVDKGKSAVLLGWTRVERRRFGVETTTLKADEYEGGLWFRAVRPGLVEAWSPHFDGVTLRLQNGEITSYTGDLPAALTKVGLHKPGPARMLLQAIPQISARGHGGALLIMPQAQVAQLSDTPALIRGGTACSYPRLASDVANLLSAQSLAEDHLWLQHVLDASQCIVGATQVDGAVLLNRELDLLQFGVEILDRPQAANRTLYSASEARVVDEREFGTRHRSAVRFCAAERPAVAIVISQDGDIRFFHSLLAGTVEVLGPFIDPTPYLIVGAFD